MYKGEFTQRFMAIFDDHLWRKLRKQDLLLEQTQYREDLLFKKQHGFMMKRKIRRNLYKKEIPPPPKELEGIGKWKLSVMTR